MEIIDLNGTEITVTDLDLAIMQADDYRHYGLSDPAQKAFMEKQQAYWEDVYQKLMALKT
jgi:hypothetical protein